MTHFPQILSYVQNCKHLFTFTTEFSNFVNISFYIRCKNPKRNQILIYCTILLELMGWTAYVSFLEAMQKKKKIKNKNQQHTNIHEMHWRDTRLELDAWSNVDLSFLSVLFMLYCLN